MDLFLFADWAMTDLMAATEAIKFFLRWGWVWWRRVFLRLSHGRSESDLVVVRLCLMAFTVCISFSNVMWTPPSLWVTLPATSFCIGEKREDAQVRLNPVSYSFVYFCDQFLLYIARSVSDALCFGDILHLTLIRLINMLTEQSRSIALFIAFVLAVHYFNLIC
jgi:hypothetical protein